MIPHFRKPMPQRLDGRGVTCAKSQALSLLCRQTTYKAQSSYHFGEPVYCEKTGPRRDRIGAIFPPRWPSPGQTSEAGLSSSAASPGCGANSGSPRMRLSSAATRSVVGHQPEFAWRQRLLKVLHAGGYCALPRAYPRDTSAVPGTCCSTCSTTCWPGRSGTMT
jgi:hypothetical protein